VHDPPPFDIRTDDIPPDGLKKYVSNRLRIAYLSKYEGTQQQLRKT
jgi:hypothetical protein